MALNLKNPEVDALATQSLLERKARLIALSVPQKRSERAASILREFRANLSDVARGTRLSREQEDDILGFGPGGA